MYNVSSGDRKLQSASACGLSLLPRGGGSPPLTGPGWLAGGTATGYPFEIRTGAPWVLSSPVQPFALRGGYFQNTKKKETSPCQLTKRPDLSELLVALPPSAATLAYTPH